jgi:hypothetical protein
MTDVFNIVKEINKLKAESKYLKKKSEITPLIATYNHVRGKNSDGYNIVYSLTIYVNNKKLETYLNDQIIALNDEIFSITEDKKVCDIIDITQIELVQTVNGEDRFFEYNFNN